MKTTLSRSFTMFLLLSFLFIVGCKQEVKKEQEAPQMEVTEETDIRGEVITYAADTTQMQGYLVYNEGETGKAPGVLVIHEWWGHNDYTRERADMLAEMGYVALAVDMYGDGKQAAHPEEAGNFAMAVMTNMDAAQARFNAALEVLRSNERVDPDKIAAIGYCFGGSVALTMANTGADLDAVAAFHSGVRLPVGPSEDLKAKVLVCNGVQDPMISKADADAFKAAMDSVNADYEYIAYENAKHGFTSKAADSLGIKFELPLAYDAAADKDSWEKLKALLGSVFGEEKEE